MASYQEPSGWYGDGVVTQADPFAPILTASSGPIGEAKTSAVSNWFYYLGAGLADQLDGTIRQPVANAGLNVGVAPNGEIYVQGSAGGAGKEASAARLSLSPSVILLAGLAFMLWQKRRG